MKQILNRTGHQESFGRKPRREIRRGWDERRSCLSGREGETDFDLEGVRGEVMVTEGGKNVAE